MDVISKLWLFLVVLFPFMANGQNAPFPKDTIYIMYSANKKENRKIKNWEYQGKKGIYFSIRDCSDEHNGRNKFISLFYLYSKPVDTISIKQLKNYHFSDLKEVIEKHVKWVDKKYKGMKYKPYNRNKNKAFKTFLIERISEDCFVKYPVIWRNEMGGP